MSTNTRSAPTDKLVVVVNGQVELEYDRSKTLPEQQQAYLRRMDEQMDGGIQLNGEWIARPDQMQRAKFVTVHLIEALQRNEEAGVAASCAYLAERLEDLKQVLVKQLGAGLSLELVFDRAYVPEAVVTFVPGGGK